MLRRVTQHVESLAGIHHGGKDRAETAGAVQALDEPRFRRADRAPPHELGYQGLEPAPGKAQGEKKQVQGGAQYQYRLQIQKDAPPDFRLVCVPTHDIHIDTHAVYQGGRQRLDVRRDTPANTLCR